MLVGCL